jgi:hypothetical protein
MKNTVLNITGEYKTPYTDIPETEGKVVRLKKTRYAKGLYRMEGVKGYEFFYITKPIKVTELQVKDPNGRWKTLMVDDPLHWLGMEELAQLCKPGTVLVGGLGLGLILHHLVKRKDITYIKVIEIDPEIVSFIKPYIPKDPRITIEVDNYFNYILFTSEKFDNAIIDLWVIDDEDPKEHIEHVKHSMITAYTLTKTIFPSAKVLVWGVRGYFNR